MIEGFGTPGVVISLARLCVPYPTDMNEGVAVCEAKRMPYAGVLYELAKMRPLWMINNVLVNFILLCQMCII